MPQTYAWLPWGKNFRALPNAIAAELERLTTEDFVIVCVKTVRDEEIARGVYAHLGITDARDLRATWTSLLPSPNVGRTSHRNASMLEEPVKTRGKTRKQIEGRAPDWRGGGVHTIRYWREVWPKRLIVPALTRLAFRRLDDGARPETADGESAGLAAGHVVRFQLQQVLNKTRPDFSDEILRCVNLLQENVGDAKILVLDAAESAYVRRASEEIGWEPLPLGRAPELVEVVARRLGGVDRSYPAITPPARARIEHLHALGPQQMLQGTGSFASCLAAVFGDLVVFEQLELEHSLYAVRGDWRELGGLSRTEMRARLAAPGGAERIVHAPGWEERLARLVKQARGEPLDAQAELF
ncbi:MAG TPA: hypothetical protein VGD81_13675 [Opitutaceae bacterium]